MAICEHFEVMLRQLKILLLDILGDQRSDDDGYASELPGLVT
jgi:hypothetical protein